MWVGLVYHNKYYGDKFEVSDFGDIRNINTGNVLKLNIVGSGYLGVCVSLGSRKNKKLFKAHRAVLESFTKNTLSKPCVNHKDGNKLNNNLSNLEWSTHQENIKHAFDNELIITSKGVNRPQSKLTDNDVRFIRNNYKPYDSIYGARAMSRQYNISHSTLLSVIKRDTWKHI